MRIPYVGLLSLLLTFSCQSQNDSGESTPPKKGASTSDAGKKNSKKDKKNNAESGDEEGQGSEEEGALGLISYVEVKPVIDKQCGGTDCHGAKGKHSPDLSTARLAAANGNAVLRRIKTDMPPKNSGRTLNPHDRDLLEKWGKDGFLTEQAKPSSTPPAEDKPGNISSNGSVVEFRIKKGTGKGAWNTPDETIHVKVGQELKVTNDDTEMHWIHTNGAPFFHPFGGIAPGETKSYKIVSPFPGGDAVHDHSTYGAIHLKAE